MAERRLTVVDCETTGLDPSAHVPVEVGWWCLATGASGVFVPPHPDFDIQNAQVIALEMNGYYDRGLDNPNRWDVDRSGLRILHERLVGQTLAGSNPRFDAAFLSPLFAADGLDPEPWHHQLENLGSYARGVLGLPYLPRLSEVCELLGIEPGDHTAGGDVTATGRAFLELAERRAGLTAAHPHAAVMLDLGSVEDCDAVARAAMQLPSGRPVRAADRAYGRRIIAALTERAAVS